MAKLHNTEDGTKPSGTSIRYCKYGAVSEEHYSSRAEAQQAYEKKMEKENELLPTTSSEKSPLSGPNLTKEEEVQITTFLNNNTDFIDDNGYPSLFTSSAQLLEEYSQNEAFKKLLDKSLKEMLPDYPPEDRLALVMTFSPKNAVAERLGEGDDVTIGLERKAEQFNACFPVKKLEPMILKSF